MPLYRDVMTQADATSRRVRAAVSALWSAPTRRVTGNALAALLVAAVGLILLGGLALIWGAAIASLIQWPVGGWAHAVLYITVVVVGPVLVLWAVQGLTALPRPPSPRRPGCCSRRRGWPGGSRGRTPHRPGRCSARPAARSWRSGSSRWPAAGPTSWPRPTPSAAGSSGIYTTARSSGWSPWP